MSRIAAPTAALALLLSACASSGPPPPVPTRTTAVTRPAVTVVTLTAEDAAFVRAYYGNQGPRGNGRGRGGGLPPGIARNLERGKPVPPGIAKQYLPTDLVRRLPALERGLEYVVVAGKLLLVETATQVVRQVLLETVFG